MTEINTTDLAAQINETAGAPAVAVKKAKTTVSKADLTQEFLKEQLDLVGEDFFWKVDKVATKTGDFAGMRRPTDGYYSVVLAGTNYSGKQLAYFYANGTWPVKVPAAAKEKAAKEAKPHVPRLAPVVTEESKVAARAAAKAAADARAAKKAAETGAVAPETVAADTSDIADVSGDADAQVL
jgi:hypothetical protein